MKRGIATHPVSVALLGFAFSVAVTSGIGIAATHTPTAAATADVGPSTGTLLIDVANQNGDPVANQTVVITDAITGDQVFNGTTDNAGQIATTLPEGSYNVNVDGDTQLVTVVGGTTTTVNVNLNTNVEQPGPLQGPSSTVASSPNKNTASVLGHPVNAPRGLTAGLCFHGVLYIHSHRMASERREHSLYRR